VSSADFIRRLRAAPQGKRLLANVPELGLDELNLLTIVAVPLIVPFAPVLVAVAVMTVILAAIIRAHIVLEGAVSLGLELVEIVRIHAHHLVGQQPYSRRRTLCISQGSAQHGEQRHGSDNPGGQSVSFHGEVRSCLTGLRAGGPAGG
jgi:hypothetical protein